MRNYSKLSPFFWLKGSGKRLRGDAIAQVVAGYLSSCPDANMVGIFYVSLATIATHTGHPVDEVRAALERIAVAEYAFYDFDAELVWVRNHAQFEIGDAMKTADKRRPKVLAELAQVDGHRFVDDFRRMYGAAFHLPVNDGATFNVPPVDLRKGHPELVEGASADPGQDKHRTIPNTGQEQGRAPSGPGRGFAPGTASATEARQAFESGVAAATGKPFALAHAPFHDRDLCLALNTHAPVSLATKSEVLRWLPAILTAWIRSAEPPTVTPTKLLDWLNAGSPKKRQTNTGGGPRGDRQPLGDWRPPASIDDDPFAPTGSEGT